MARSAVPPSLSDAVVASIIADVQEARGRARRDLPKVAPALRPALDAALQRAGLEVTRAAVRVPARAQLVALLEEGGPVQEKGLAGHLVCVTPAELKVLAARLMGEGALRRVERPSGPALALTSERALQVDRALRLVGDLEQALKWLRKATRGPQRARPGLLEADVADFFARLRAGAATTGAPAQDPGESSGSLLDRVTRATSELAAQHGGLAPVPLLVRSLGASTASIHAALREGHARGLLELQPESSMGRLGAEELALCPPGPEGTRLSWVRPLKPRPPVERSSAT